MRAVVAFTSNAEIMFSRGVDHTRRHTCVLVHHFEAKQSILIVRKNAFLVLDV